MSRDNKQIFIVNNLKNSKIFSKELNSLLNFLNEPLFKSKLFVAVLFVTFGIIGQPLIYAATSAATKTTPKLTPVSTTAATLAPTALPLIYKVPRIGSSWQWQLTGTVREATLDLVTRPKVYDIDMFNSSAGLISRLKAKGIYVICYMETGDWANSRPDAGTYAPAILGKTLDGFADEKFVNITAIDSPAGPSGKTLRQIMMARLDLARSKGCDGIEPDLDDLQTYNTGFIITEAAQLRFNTMMINNAHARGMSLGLKNGATATTGSGSFEKKMLNAGADWALNEECNQYNECIGYTQFIAAGKPVFQVEYFDNQKKSYSGVSGTCALDNKANFNGIVKDSSSKLSALPWIPCR